MLDWGEKRDLGKEKGYEDVIFSLFYIVRHFLFANVLCNIYLPGVIAAIHDEI